MPAAVNVPLQGGPLHESPVSITSKQLFLRESAILGRAGSSDRLLARLYRFIGLDSLEQTQDLLGFISTCCGIENPSLRIDDFPEVSGLLDYEMF